ncbi:MAG: hypothetical protein ACYCX0_05595, partial [Desulfurivibrionaceae bacterium]
LIDKGPDAAGNNRDRDGNEDVCPGHMALLLWKRFCRRMGRKPGQNSGEAGLFGSLAFCLLCEMMCGAKPIFRMHAWGGKC